MSDALLSSLAALSEAHPLERKRLVATDVNFGREALTALARQTGGWIGWEACNLRGIADALAFLPLSEQGVRAANDVEIDALVAQAMARAVEQRRVSQRFAALERSLGFRRALRDAVLELRTGGISVDDVRAGAPHGSPAEDVAPVLEEYERLLAARKLADPAAVFRVAIAHFEREAPFVLDGITAIVPWLDTRGLAGELLRRLLARGACLLDVDTGRGLAAPEHLLATPARDESAREAASLLAWAAGDVLPDETLVDRTLVDVDLFAAATPSEELREVFRRVLAEGHRWDEVEIVATDPDTYGIALDALCQRLGFGATMLRGLPLARTRIGRALERWCVWLEDGLPADVLRQALEAGEIGGSTDGVSSGALARELRRLGIGWGRERYDAAVARLDGGETLSHVRRREDESDEEFAARRSALERVTKALATLLRGILDATPVVPERGSDEPERATCASLAHAALRWLALVPIHGQAEAQTVERLREDLTTLAAIEQPATSFATAMAELREALAEVRAWPLITSERKPWSSAGGMPHLTDISHAGTTARPRVFVVGMDVERTAGSATQDPLLPDSTRAAVAADRLATSVERRATRAWVNGAALASLRGRVTLSYATSANLDGREAGPSPILLQVWRLLRRDASLSYEGLREQLRPPMSAVPLRRGGELHGIALLDARDVWLDALTDGALLLDGSVAVRSAYPMLAAGLAAYDAARGLMLTAHHGLVPAAGLLLDPAARANREISPSSLETLSKCPLSWFYRYGLSLYEPDDPEYDPDRWLDALERGSLLHEIYEAFTREYRDRQAELGGDAARGRILAIADDRIRAWRDDVPPPGELVFEAEAAELRASALAFLRMEQDYRASGDRAQWLDFELQFGWERPAGRYALPDGRTLAVRGFADRVDVLADGTLRIVDYKTGSPRPYERSARKAPFNGGRQLQPALYVAAVETITGRTVSRFEYRFPTERGRNETVAYSAGELQAVRVTVGALLDHVRAGEFVPTNDTEDCAYCAYQGICRATRDEYSTASPRADWAKDRAPELPQYVTMLARRAPGGRE